MTDERRPAGAGYVEEHRGRFRGRLTLTQPDGSTRRVRLRSHATREEAELSLEVACEELATGRAAPVGAVTLHAFGHAWLKKRELSRDYRDVTNTENVFKNHIDTAPIGDLPLVAITDGDVREWRDALKQKRIKYTHAHERNGRHLARETVKRAFSVLSCILAAAAEDNVIKESPARDVRPYPEKARMGRVDDVWTFLTLKEQQKIAACKAIPEADRLLMEVAWTTGLRSSELAWLRLEDVHLDDRDPHFDVRRSRDDGPTKSGKKRDVPILPRLRPLMRRWLQLLPSYCPNNERGLAFPTPSGAVRQAGKMLGSAYDDPKKGQKRRKLDKFALYLRAAGIARHVRFHDLRHTAATSLVSGFWGPVWRMEDVRDFLGHGSLKQCEQYAHLAETSVKAAARATIARSSKAPAKAPAHFAPGSQTPGIVGSHFGDLNSRPTVYETVALPLS